MTDIPSSLSKIQIEETQFRSTVSEATMQKIGGTCNAIIDQGIEVVGTVVQSILTQTQFQSLKGNNWVKMQGQSIVGSDLNSLTGLTTLPNAVGQSAFFRQATSDGNVGTYQDSDNKSHRHQLRQTTTTNPATGEFPKIWSAWTEIESDKDSAVNDGGFIDTDYAGLAGVSNTGGSESRPKNFQMNFFIKINNNPS